LFSLIFLFFLGSPRMVSKQSKKFSSETKAQKEQRMKWWEDARFGLFIHWGLYSVPAGEWKGDTTHAEWIRTTAQNTYQRYEKFVQQFDPEKFNAEEWVKMPQRPLA
jgi:alpha-L-fucosidase